MEKKKKFSVEFQVWSRVLRTATSALLLGLCFSNYIHYPE